MFTFFFFNETATTEIYTLSLHDALPIYASRLENVLQHAAGVPLLAINDVHYHRSEEHTSELQSHVNLVCRLLLEKKNRDHARADAVADRQPHPHYRRRLRVPRLTSHASC